MNNKAIKTYEDLLQEEQRLTAQLSSYKHLIKEDMDGVKQGIKDKLNPVKKAKDMARNLFIQEGKNGPALNAAIKFVTDFVVNKILPKRTSVWTKTIIPFISRNVVTHMITDEQRTKISQMVNEAVAKIDAFFRKNMAKKPHSYRSDSTHSTATTSPYPNL
jgi:ribosomal protein S20